MKDRITLIGCEVFPADVGFFSLHKVFIFLFVTSSLCYTMYMVYLSKILINDNYLHVLLKYALNLLPMLNGP